MNLSEEHTKLSSTTRGVEWLTQFDIQDQPDAKLLLDKIRWISANDFSKALEENIQIHADSINGPVALFIERELRKPGGHYQRFYKERGKPKRAHGAALQPIESKKPYAHEIGSEGIISSIATSFIRRNKRKYYLHPTAEQIRSKKIRAFLVLTDNIGSGNQMSDFLSSLWKVASIKSWTSAKFIQFGVIAYAVTDVGENIISSHPSKPKITYSIPCPTIHSQFSSADTQRLIQLCNKYNPCKNNNIFHSLGFGSNGALIAYSHGMPNNAPNIFHKKSRNWNPMFPRNTTTDVRYEMNSGQFEIDAQKVLEQMNQSRLAASKWIQKLDGNGIKLLLILSSLSWSPRTYKAISTRTELKIPEVRKLIHLAIHYGWVTDKFRLTDEGMNLLSYLKTTEKPQITTLSKPSDIFYYPKSLRTSGTPI